MKYSLPIGICSVCKREKGLINHHLSYDPEITLSICWGCHSTMHRLSEKTIEQQNIIIQYVKEYGHLWKNGREKHQAGLLLKTGGTRNGSKELRKKYNREYYWRSEKYRNHKKAYGKEYRLKKQLRDTRIASGNRANHDPFFVGGGH